MSYTLVGPSLYVNDRGKLFSKEGEKYQPISTKETQAEDRYVSRHSAEGGKNNAQS